MMRLLKLIYPILAHLINRVRLPPFLIELDLRDISKYKGLLFLADVGH